MRRLLLAGVAVLATLAIAVPQAQAATPYPSANNNIQPNPNCALVVPPNPLSAQGLATPYELVGIDGKGACHEASPAQSAFVEATILDPATGALSIYRPLVIDRGTKPGIVPTVPTLPQNAVVGIWFGFQGDTLTLLHAQGCVNGVFRSNFGQFAYCNAPEFFDAAHKAMAAGLLTVPTLGTAKDGLPCPTTRDFSVVDQDQSDNVITRYVVLSNGLIAQDDGTNATAASFLNNGSDNGLLDSFILPALGCPQFQAPDLTAKGRLSSSLALNELQAELQPDPVALVPPSDPMTLVKGRKNFAKTNLYRAGVDQTPIGGVPPNPVAGQRQDFRQPVEGFGFAPFLPLDNSRQYCADLVNVGLPRLFLDRRFTLNQPSPDIAMAPNLFLFLQQRFKATLQNLGCPMGNPPKNGGN